MAAHVALASPNLEARLAALRAQAYPVGMTALPADRTISALTRTRLVRDREHELREHGAWQPAELERLACTAEATAVLCTAAELLVRMRVQSFEELVERSAEFDEALKRFSRVRDVARVIGQNPDFFAADERPGAWPTIDIDDFVQLAESFLVNFRIERVEHAAANHRLSAVGLRCRNAFESLQTMVRRHREPAPPVLHVLGTAYAQGRLTVIEVATVLGVHVADALVLFEQHGYSRPLEVIRLSPEDRKQRLALLRRERLEGLPATDDDFVRREVVATQRIEGIDARHWLDS